ncbi:LysE family transporter [Selenihalanaerobacter shriftii]|uniref:Threonine/homoserine/homoserine lactone efflux protein n=1 Tax=Selenihalanaerobacter shriftii TaxID=142842 RepID=A0A1T4NFT5_9FIRM|nr:LysE family transporter [Selenihalanaerobacter shriftii]SJZ78231.1 Threonine/homoserine/homoserine lactone efflux protein [Selenihalanaerobacter shriftii]
MELDTLFITALIIGFSGAMMPGPLLTATVNESYHKGASAGPRIILGHSILELLLIIGLIMGLGSFLVLSSVKITISIVGGLFLLWMGIGIIKDAGFSKVKLELAAVGSNKSLQPEAIGVLTSISNPYWTIWWATIGLGYVTMAWEQGIIGLIVFYLGHISADFIWYTGVSFGIASGKEMLSDNIYRIILLICGVFLVGLSLYFIYLGVKPLGIF